MKKFIVTPLVSVGEINFGMEREKTREILGKYSEYKNFPEDNNTADCFDICQVFYSTENRVDFIMFHELEFVEIQCGNEILTQKTKEELISLFSGFDEELSFEIDFNNEIVSFESNSLGIACYFLKDIYFDEEGNEHEFDKVETISFSIKDYWK